MNVPNWTNGGCLDPRLPCPSERQPYKPALTRHPTPSSPQAVEGGAAADEASSTQPAQGPRSRRKLAKDAVAGNRVADGRGRGGPTGGRGGGRAGRARGSSGRRPDLDDSRGVFDSVWPPGEDDTDGGLATAEAGGGFGDDPMIAELTFAAFDQLAELTGLDASGLGASFLHGAYSISPDAVAAALAADFGAPPAGSPEDGASGAGPAGGRAGLAGAAAAVLRTSEAEMQALLDSTPSPKVVSEESLSNAGRPPAANDGGGAAGGLSDLPELSPSHGAPSRPVHGRLGAETLHIAGLHTAAVHTGTGVNANGDCKDMRSGGAAASAGGGGLSTKRPLACDVASRSVLARTAA